MFAETLTRLGHEIELAMILGGVAVLLLFVALIVRSKAR